MLTKSHTGTWLPAWVPGSSLALAFILLFCAMVESAVSEYWGTHTNDRQTGLMAVC